VKKIKLFRNEDGVLVIEKCGIIEEHYLTEESFLEDLNALWWDENEYEFDISNELWKLVRPVVKNRRKQYIKRHREYFQKYREI
jgi:hypothetical protein